MGAGRVGVHLAPRGDEHDMGDVDPRETFGYALEQLGQRQIAFFFTREYLADDSISEYMKERSNGVPYIANPDLYERLIADAPLNELVFDNMIGSQTAEGYIDYPSLEQLADAGVIDA